MTTCIGNKLGVWGKFIFINNECFQAPYRRHISAYELIPLPEINAKRDVFNTEKQRQNLEMLNVTVFSSDFGFMFKVRRVFPLPPLL